MRTGCPARRQSGISLTSRAPEARWHQNFAKHRLISARCPLRFRAASASSKAQVGARQCYRHAECSAGRGPDRRHRLLCGGQGCRNFDAMSNVLQQAFYLPRPRAQACDGLDARNELRPFRRRCGAALRQRSVHPSSVSLITDLQPPSLVAFYAAARVAAALATNVSSAAVQPASLLRPA